MRVLIPGLLLYGLSLSAGAITLTVSDANIPSTALGTLDSAGDYFPSSVESLSQVAAAAIGSAPTTPAVSNSECGATDPAWKLQAQLSTSVAGLTLRVRRTSNGTGGTVYGGESYITLSALPTTLFCGNSDVADIGLQFQIDAVDVGDGHGTRQWQVDYTVETL
ncbi:hypothetical protein [Thiothrix eikelboomii]|uniref:hypothetical protein n=1 Tax=Thiothrix eikelboomii TaxID=92487 RepID=UPI003BB13436